MLRTIGTKASGITFRGVRFQSTNPTVKKSKPFRKFLFRLGLLTGVFYAGGVAVSLKNDIVQDAFIEHVPLGEALLDFTEYYVNHPEELSFSSTKQKLQNFDKTVLIPKRGVQSAKVEDIEHIKNVTRGSADESVSLSKTIYSNLNLPSIDLEFKDEVLQSSVEHLNHLIDTVRTQVNTVDLLPQVEQLKSSIKELGSKYNSFVTDRNTAVEEALAKLDDELKTKYQNKELALTDKYISDLQETKRQIELKHDQILAKELDTAQRRILLEAENIIVQARINTLSEFESIISDKIDNERNGKLKNLDALAKRVEELENVQIKLFDNISNAEKLTNLKKTVSKINRLLISSNDGVDAKILINEVNKFKTYSKDLNNELISSVLLNLPNDKALSNGVLSQAQLLARWDLLTLELRSASLLPPNAGILGHLSSKLFSFFLLGKSGTPTSGNDIESVISRVHDNLLKNRLDDALEEVSSLKGWSRKLSEDWIVEARKKLELQVLVGVLENEVSLL
ncbi:MICOS complex subunit mic60 [Komagataella kurtzmanii]|nr:MICOS complex subunit mic60 [Komagataella kurtzmanii]